MISTFSSGAKDKLMFLLANLPVSNDIQQSGASSKDEFEPSIDCGTITDNHNSSSYSLLDYEYGIAMEAIQRYSNFEPGWDGYFGRPVPSGVISLAIDILQKFYIKCFLENYHPDSIEPCPASDGSVDLEFFKGEKYLAFTISHDWKKIVSFSTNSTGQERREFDVELDTPEARMAFVEERIDKFLY